MPGFRPPCPKSRSWVYHSGLLDKRFCHAIANSERSFASHLGGGPGGMQDFVQVVQVVQDHKPGFAQVVIQSVGDVE